MPKPAISALIIASLLLVSHTGYSKTKYASANGRASNSGNSASSPWDSESCFTSLSPGDRCVYLPGNYRMTRFAPTRSGTATSRIVHECQTRYGCSFDRIEIVGVSYLTIRRIKSDSEYYDSSHSPTNPRAKVINSHHITFDSIYVRGEPQRCADGNPTVGCPAGTQYHRYNDLFEIGSNDPGSSSHHIEITGRTQLLNANHTVVGFYDDNDSTTCEPRESNIWIHGTESAPVIVSMLYHHNFAFKGSCHVLVEYVDFLQAGNGRGDLQQPHKANNDVQAGGTFHGSDFQHVVVRFSTVSKGGSATSDNRNGAHIEVGLFSNNLNRVDGACFAHLSHHQSWGPVAIMGRANSVARVSNVAMINNAVSEAWHMYATKPGVVSSPYAEYLLARVGSSGNFSAYVDGLVGGSTFGSNRLLYHSNNPRNFNNAPFTVEGLQVGPNVTRYDGNLFVNPSARNFTPKAGTPLIGSASPIALTTNNGSGRRIKVDRPECFMGTMDGMRQGDLIDINGDQCRVEDVDLGSSEITCANSVNWQAGEEIYYKVNGAVARDIGARQTGGGTRPRPPTLTISP